MPVLHTNAVNSQFQKLIQQATDLLSRKAYQQCHAACMAAIKLNPRHGEPLFLLSILTADHHNYGKALDIIDRALAADGTNAKYLAQKAKLLTLLNRQTDAAITATRAAELSPTDAFTVDTLGVVFSRIGDHASAVPFFRLACDHQPDNADYHYNLGSSLRFSGDFDAAASAFSRALELAPDHYAAHYALASLSKQTADNNKLNEQLALFENCTDADGRLHLGHAIAKTYEDFGDYPKALEYLKAAKAKKRETLDYSFTEDAALFDAAHQLTIPNIAENPDTGGGPIFIMGMPRTGTTLTDRILSSHSQIVSAGELSHFGLLLKQAAKTQGQLVLDPATLQQAANLDLKAIGQAYLRDTDRLRGDAPYYIDKMPLNFFYVPLILAAIPSARIIVLRRNPMDACLSNYRQLFRTSYSYYNYAYDLADTAHYYNAFNELITHWRNTMPANRFTEIAYEDIIHNQEAETRRLLDFCGVEFEEACMSFHQNAAPTATASSVQVRKPLYSSSIDRWKKYGDGLQAMKKVLNIE